MGDKLTAHDVRHLWVCAICKTLADDRETIRPRGRHFEELFRNDYDLNAHWHPGCFVQTYGEEMIFCLSQEERRKFRLCDVSTEIMIRLLDEASDG